MRGLAVGEMKPQTPTLQLLRSRESGSAASIPVASDGGSSATSTPRMRFVRERGISISTETLGAADGARRTPLVSPQVAPPPQPWTPIPSPMRNNFMSNGAAAGISEEALNKRKSPPHSVVENDLVIEDDLDLCEDDLVDPQEEIAFEDLNEMTLIDEGSSCVVHRAEYRGRPVAVKLLKNQQESPELFRRETVNLQRLRHPNIVALLGIHSQQPYRCIVMEFVDGPTLFDVIHSRSHVYDWLTVFKYGIDISSGMSYLHGLSPPLIHRDLKSLNILVHIGDADEMTAKICDFGLSKTKQTATQMTARCGTFQYMAPEMLAPPFEYNELVDVFSFGMILWELVARQFPYDTLMSDDDAGQDRPFQRAIDYMETVVVRKKRPKVPPFCSTNMRHLIASCWDQDPSKRPSFADIHHLLSSPDAPMLVEPDRLDEEIACSTPMRCSLEALPYDVLEIAG